MRLFTAIDLSAEMLLRLERLLSALRPEALIKWSPLDNLHVTTKFIGEWPERRLEELHEALAGLTPRDVFDVEVRDLGWFPNERSPRVLWAGVHAGPALQQLIAETEERLLSLGVAKEEKPANPHLTLARIKNPAPLRNLRKKVDELQPAALGTFAVRHFCLFRSDPGSNASIYRKLKDYKFEVAAVAAR
jgi:RNA 2',3'-cyclic 3'-phosphodiesterase